MDSTTPLTIGQKQGSEGILIPSFIGMIDEVRVWNRALGQEEIQRQMFLKLAGNEPGIVGYWNFDDGTANDSSTSQNNGAFVGSAQAVEDPLALLKVYHAVEIISFSGSSSGSYQLQFKGNGQAETWNNLGEPFAGGQPVRFFDTTRDSDGKIYRVIRIQ